MTDTTNAAAPKPAAPPVKIQAGVKSGTQTTEWQLTVAAIIAGTLLILKGSPEMAAFGQQLITLALPAYAVSRGIAKAGAKAGVS